MANSNISVRFKKSDCSGEGEEESGGRSEVTHSVTPQQIVAEDTASSGPSSLHLDTQSTAQRQRPLLTNRSKIEQMKAYSIDTSTEVNKEISLAGERRKWLSDKFEKISKTIEDKTSFKEGIIASIRKAGEVRDGKPLYGGSARSDNLYNSDPQQITPVRCMDSPVKPKPAPISPANMIKNKIFEFASSKSEKDSDAKTTVESSNKDGVSERVQEVEAPSCVRTAVVHHPLQFDPESNDALGEIDAEADVEEEVGVEMKEGRASSFRIVDDHFEPGEVVMGQTCDDVVGGGGGGVAMSQLLSTSGQRLEEEESELVEQSHRQQEAPQQPVPEGAGGISGDGGGCDTPSPCPTTPGGWFPTSGRYSGLQVVKYVCVAVLAALYACLVPYSPYLAGLLMGVFITALITAHLAPHHSLLPPTAHTTPPLPLPLTTLYHCMHEGRNNIYKGWLNELVATYDCDNYHINQTHSVYVRLEGTSLRLSRPKQNIPRRAMYNEPRYEPTFIHQRHFIITDSKVYLLPTGLAKKRIWSKKYPICIQLAHGGKKIRRTMTQLVNQQANYHSDGEECAGGKTGAGPGFPHSSSMETLAKENCNDQLLYLFARTNREKEIWFHRLDAAANARLREPPIGGVKKPMAKSSSSSEEDYEFIGESEVLPKNLHSDNEIDFDQYMSRLLPKNTYTTENANKDDDDGLVKDKSHFSITEVPTKRWLNAFLGRLLFDFLREETWKEMVQVKIQRKLDKIRVPHMLEGLTITHLTLGDMLPQINDVTSVHVNEQGLWFDLKLNYHGNFNMTIKTNLNLMKLKSPQTAAAAASKTMEDDHMCVVSEVEAGAVERRRVARQRQPMSDSDAEDSAESSSDEEQQQQALHATELSPTTTAGAAANTIGPTTLPTPITNTSPAHSTNTTTTTTSTALPTPNVVGSADAGSSGGVSSKRLLRLVDHIAASRYFQQATENKYIKKAMEGISNTPIVLNVVVKSLTGVLTLNVPPPPTDRLWYGFRTNPALLIAAKPKVGMRQVNIGYITDWIESRLTLEFQRVLVLPNMDDLYIPIMSSDVTMT